MNDALVAIVITIITAIIGKVIEKFIETKTGKNYKNFLVWFILFLVASLSVFFFSRFSFPYQELIDRGKKMNKSVVYPSINYDIQLDKFDSTYTVSGTVTYVFVAVQDLKKTPYTFTETFRNKYDYESQLFYVNGSQAEIIENSSIKDVVKLKIPISKEKYEIGIIKTSFVQEYTDKSKMIKRLIFDDRPLLNNSDYFFYKNEEDDVIGNFTISISSRTLNFDKLNSKGWFNKEARNVNYGEFTNETINNYNRNMISYSIENLGRDEIIGVSPEWKTP